MLDGGSIGRRNVPFRISRAGEMLVKCLIDNDGFKRYFKLIFHNLIFLVCMNVSFNVT